MLKGNYKRLVSALSAAAMLSGLAVPAAMAENEDVDAAVVQTSSDELVEAEATEAQVPSVELSDADSAALSDEYAELKASGTLINKIDFNNEAAGDLIQLSTAAQDAYTGIDGLKFYIGSY
jgi:hypothetical protein